MPVFNPYIATHPRTSRRQSEVSSANDGAAKIPRVGVNKSDLEAQGIQYGWSAGPLTPQEVREMSSSELRWHELFNADNLEKALALPAKIKEGKDIDRQWAIKRMWEGRVSPEQDENARAAGDAFAIRHPTFARTIENAMLMVEHMKSRGLDATEISSYTTAFRELTEQGKLTVAPAESADDFYKAHPELHDRRTPQVIAARAARTEQTAKHFEAAASAAVKGNVVNVVDYEHEPGRGVPPYSEIDKASLRSLVQKMSSAELAEKCQNDSSFKKALDSLE